MCLQKRLSGERDVTPGMENVTQQLCTQTHTLTHSHTTQRHVKGQARGKKTQNKQHTHRQTKTEEDINTKTVNRGTET